MEKVYDNSDEHYLPNQRFHEYHLPIHAKIDPLQDLFDEHPEEENDENYEASSLAYAPSSQTNLDPFFLCEITQSLLHNM